MSKESIVWLIVRSIGAYLGYQGIQAIITFIGMLLLVSQTRKADLSAAVILQQLLLATFLLGSGAYLLLDGTLLFDLMNKERPANKIGDSFEDVSIKDDRENS